LVDETTGPVKKTDEILNYIKSALLRESFCIGQSVNSLEIIEIIYLLLLPHGQ
jgi:hypothetical protein